MLVTCVGNSSKFVRADYIASFNRYVNVDEVGLKLGQDYLVFGVIFRDDAPWFLVCEEEDDHYPVPQFSELFDITDARIPGDWYFARGIINLGGVAILPQVWADTPTFLENLMDGDVDALRDFRELKIRLRDWHSTAGAVPRPNKSL